MFTSRAEYRLMLRIDNADLRLTPAARDAGLIDDEHWERFSARRDRFAKNVSHLKEARVRLASGERVPASQALKQPDVRLSTLVAAGEVAVELTPNCGHIDAISAETTVKFEGYLLRQEQSVERARRQEQRKIPSEFAYSGVPGLSTEMVQRFEQVRPTSLGQALRIPGVTPAAVAVLGAYVERFADERA
jgi:tRNA uridine 5-carboxymethylaminomethyl modification enzyme